MPELGWGVMGSNRTVCQIILKNCMFYYRTNLKTKDYSIN
jgi:hypothetical protein